VNPAVPAKGKVHPCHQIMEACKAAGFAVGKAALAGRHAFKDCVKPIMADKTVEGVTVDPATVRDCKAMKGAHAMHKHGGMNKAAAGGNE
jgi:hypothetical protein